MNRREVLQAAAAVPVVAVASRVPDATLDVEDLRLLAMCSTPPSTWIGRWEDYRATRVYDRQDFVVARGRELERRGLVKLVSSRGGPDCDAFFVATEAGCDELRKNGIEARVDDRMAALLTSAA